LTGEFRTHRGFTSRFLKPSHDVVVHLPPHYLKDETRRYSVLYMQDGQNLFDPSTAFGGQEWRADETADALAIEGAIEPLIIAGIYNAGEERIEEYTASRDPNLGHGGRADLYGRMVVEELKPFIDRQYRTRRHAQSTGVGGSSLGGLVSLFLGLRYPKVFGKVAVLSPSVWWHDRAILSFVQTAELSTRPKVWLDVGTAEGTSPERSMEDARLLRDALIGRGWRLHQDLQYFEDHGAAHHERAWGARVGPMLRFLFPA
jgi:predicted alpha/beta superfamily hydrolase